MRPLYSNMLNDVFMLSYSLLPMMGLVLKVFAPLVLCLVICLAPPTPPIFAIDSSYFVFEWNFYTANGLSSDSIVSGFGCGKPTAISAYTTLLWAVGEDLCLDALEGALGMLSQSIERFLISLVLTLSILFKGMFTLPSQLSIIWTFYWLYYCWCQFSIDIDVLFIVPLNENLALVPLLLFNCYFFFWLLFLIDLCIGSFMECCWMYVIVGFGFYPWLLIDWFWEVEISFL